MMLPITQNLPDPARCPLCREPNVCSMAAGPEGAVVCWCATARVPPALLDLVPDDERDLACICEACIGTFHADPVALEARRARVLSRLRSER